MYAKIGNLSDTREYLYFKKKSILRNMPPCQPLPFAGCRRLPAYGSAAVCRQAEIHRRTGKRHYPRGVGFPVGANRCTAVEERGLPPNLYQSTSTVAQVLQVLKLPDGTVKVLVEGLYRGRVLTIEDTGGLLRISHIEAVVEEDTGGNTGLEAVRRIFLAQFEQYAKLNKKNPRRKLSAAINSIAENSKLTDTVAAHFFS